MKSYNPAVYTTSTIKTLARGLSKTRLGSPSIGIHNLIEASKRKGFLDRIKKAVSEDEALDAAKMLSTKGRLRRYVEGGLIGGMSYPVISAASEAAKGFTAHSGPGKLRAARAAARAVLKGPEIAKSVTRGVMGGGVIQAVREGIELGRAKKTVRQFIDERTKGSAVEPAPQSAGIPRRRPYDPWRYDPHPAGEF
jgi:hypothetical protein